MAPSCSVTPNARRRSAGGSTASRHGTASSPAAKDRTDGPAYFDRAPVIASVNPLRNLPFVVDASVSEADTLSEWYQQRLWVILGSISAVICAIGTLRLFARQYRRLELSELSLARKNTELDIARRQLNATLSNLSQGVCFFGADWNLLVYNQRYCDIFGLPEAAIRVGMSLAEIAERRVAAGSFLKQSVAEYLASIDAIIRAGTPHASITELTNGRTISFHLQPLSSGGWVATHEDISERREAEAKIAFLARHDVLTGLVNRVVFQERLEYALAMADRGQAFAVMCLDLDRFKAVNDTLGHPVGDSLLRAVANRLRDVARETDTVARLGGDEFAILVSDASEVAATAVARRIVTAINRPFLLEGHEVSVGTSVGIALSPRDSSHPVQLMKQADLALYRSKQEGRGTWRFFEPAMDAAAATRRALEADLRNALPLGEMELFYQPLLNARTRTVSCFEALLRWRHPKRGLVLPDQFIALAEEIGLIAEIGALVLHRACTEAASWPPYVRVAVNLSARQFRGHDLVATVADALRSTGLPPERLELEITESVPLQTDQATLSVLRDLHALGTRIALDDFCTGYSSLSYLRGFPFDTIKIDRSFVADLNTRGTSLGIIRGIIGLATNLQMNVTAEGVETEEQFDFLARAGCTEVQGFLISPAVPRDQVAGLLERLSGQEASTSHNLALLTG